MKIQARIIDRMFKKSCFLSYQLINLKKGKRIMVSMQALGPRFGVSGRPLEKDDIKPGTVFTYPLITAISPEYKRYLVITSNITFKALENAYEDKVHFLRDYWKSNPPEIYTVKANTYKCVRGNPFRKVKKIASEILKIDVRSGINDYFEVVREINPANIKHS